jgi:regulation of enolase protein 1 (concanavalin A-like superfamily)
MPQRRHCSTAACWFAFLAFLCWIAGLPAPAARGGIVRTFDGKRYEGLVMLGDGGQVRVRTAPGVSERIELKDVLSVLFRTPEPELAASSSPGRWFGRDLGRAGVPGSARFTGGVATVRATGADIGGTADAGYFVYQLMDGDGQIVARLSSLQQTHRDAKAGLMIRASAEISSPCAAILARAGGDTRFQVRPKLAAPTKDTSAGAAGAPCWLRLERRGDQFTGYTSADGQNWELLASETLNLPSRVLVGLVVASHNDAAVCTAVFERVTVSAMEMAETEQSAAPAKGVLLRRGTLLSGSVDSMDSSVLHMQEPLRSIPTAEVAQVLYKPVGSELARKLRPGQTGILLSDGDFVEGEVLGIDNRRVVRLSSVLFGLRREETYKVAAIVLHDLAPVPTQYEIRLRTGSVLYEDKITVGKEMLIVDDPVLGPMQLHGSSILEIRAGRARFQSLLDLKPIRSEKSGGIVMDAAVGAVGMLLGGRSCSHGIGLNAGSSVSYDLSGAYRILVLRAGIPEGILPTSAVRFIVRGDGREIYRSSPRTSLDEPLAATLNVGGVKVLSLSVEAVDDLAVGASGLFGDPALVK